MYNKEPVIAICGDGGSGKDSVASLFNMYLDFPYVTSTSGVAGVMIWDELSTGKLPWPDSPNQWTSYNSFYQDRVNHRQFWADWIMDYNAENGADALYRLACKQGNRILTGIRKRVEFQACRKEPNPLIDIAVWIDFPGVPRDPTQEYGPELCDLIIENHKDQWEETTRRVMAICRFIRIASSVI